MASIQVKPVSANAEGRGGALKFSRVVWRWLVEPPLHLPEFERRQRRLLAALLVTLIALSLLSIIPLGITNQTGNLLTAPALPLILGAASLLGVVYVIYRAGNYELAATLTVWITLLGAWGGVYVSRSDLESNPILLAFGLCAILLSSVMLSLARTVLVAITNLAGVAFIPPALATISSTTVIVSVVFQTILSALMIVV